MGNEVITKEVNTTTVETVERQVNTTIVETIIFSAEERKQMQINSLLSSSPE